MVTWLRSFFKVKGQILSFRHNYWSSRDGDLIFAIYVYIWKLHVLENCHVKVKVILQGQRSDILNSPHQVLSIFKIFNLLTVSICEYLTAFKLLFYLT